MIHVCARCVLSTTVPGVTIDADGICSVCSYYDDHRRDYDAYFGCEQELCDIINRATTPQRTFDCLLLFSGGKDSTYALYRLVRFGFRVLAVTFDNGYIPRGCFTNIENVCRELGVQSRVVSVDKNNMDAVFSESLRNDSTVCSGCFRALTARSTEVAIAEGIPVILTGLSRGQIVDTKVNPLIQSGIKDTAEIDRHLKDFRAYYHRTKDRIATLIDDRALENEAAFEQTAFVDFYRYCPVTKAEIVSYLEANAPFWVKPEHVGGCSTNCLINDVGIQVHMEVKGYHNYAPPLAWDVRFGHIGRNDALSDLTSEVDARKTQNILRSIKPLAWRVDVH